MNKDFNKIKLLKPTVKKEGIYYYDENLEKIIKSLKEKSQFYSLYEYKNTIYALISYSDDSMDMLSIYPKTEETIKLSKSTNCPNIDELTLNEIIKIFEKNLMGFQEYLDFNNENIINKNEVHFMNKSYNVQVIDMKVGEEYIIFSLNNNGYFIKKLKYNGFKSYKDSILKILIFDQDYIIKTQQNSFIKTALETYDFFNKIILIPIKKNNLNNFDYNEYLFNIVSTIMEKNSDKECEDYLKEIDKITKELLILL